MRLRLKVRVWVTLAPIHPVSANVYMIRHCRSDPLYNLFALLVTWSNIVSWVVAYCRINELVMSLEAVGMSTFIGRILSYKNLGCNYTWMNSPFSAVCFVRKGVTE